MNLKKVPGHSRHATHLPWGIEKGCGWGVMVGLKAPVVTGVWLLLHELATRVSFLLQRPDAWHFGEHMCVQTNVSFMHSRWKCAGLYDVPFDNWTICCTLLSNNECQPCYEHKTAATLPSYEMERVSEQIIGS